ncbi:hypothetical protein ACS0TY_021344 [Phlomoides rotata]
MLLSVETNCYFPFQIALDEKDFILSSFPPESREKGSVLYASLTDGKDGLKNLLQYIKDKDPDKVSVGLTSTLDTLALFELLQVMVAFIIEISSYFKLYG